MAFQTRLPDFRTFQPRNTTPIDRLNRWIREYYAPLCGRCDFLDVVLASVFRQALRDQVARLESSLDVTATALFQYSPQQLLEKIDAIHQEIAPDMEFSLDLGLSRRISREVLQKNLDAFLAAALADRMIGGIDLYDQEDAQPPEVFRPLYQQAKSAGLLRKAHVGEFGSPESVRSTVEILELDEIQHGIQIYRSPEVMRWIVERNIPLNLSPISNQILGAVDFHTPPSPLEILTSAGVAFTFHTDDFLLFETSIQEQEKIFLTSPGQ
ncbi:MAG: hypothetical protein Q4D38_00030 [Planctomycetia bacterium]|nr:hypothetical protein [Planctomycetia bacterium]